MSIRISYSFTICEQNSQLSWNKLQRSWLKKRNLKFRSGSVNQKCVKRRVWAKCQQTFSWSLFLGSHQVAEIIEWQPNQIDELNRYSWNQSPLWLAKLKNLKTNVQTILHFTFLLEHVLNTLRVCITWVQLMRIHQQISLSWWTLMNKPTAKYMLKGITAKSSLHYFVSWFQFFALHIEREMKLVICTNQCSIGQALIPLPGYCNNDASRPCTYSLSSVFDVINPRPEIKNAKSSHYCNENEIISTKSIKPINCLFQHVLRNSSS